MIIVRLFGGLGNQMFQYAAARNLAHKYNSELKINLDILLDRTAKSQSYVFRDYDLSIFNIQENFASKHEVDKIIRRSRNDFFNRILNKIFGYKRGYVRESNFKYSESISRSGDNILLEGYWQTEKYFFDVREILKKEFTFKNTASENINNFIEKIRQVDSVCVNVRRGDFLTNSNHGFCGLEYYKKARQIINNKVRDPHYFVFSDDIEWCREHLVFFENVVFVSHDFAGNKFQDYLRLMQNCKNYIIPNSSFAWWAVWLNGDENKIVIAPSTWYKGGDTSDIYNSSWIVI